jgi:hypothetical protein
MKWSFGIVLVFGVLTAPPARGQCEFQKLTASDAMELDVFGISADMDGDYLVIGARNLGTSTHRPGAAYTFRRIGQLWVAQIKITASDGNKSDNFGRACTADDEYVVVGAPADNDACPRKAVGCSYDSA